MNAQREVQYFGIDAQVNWKHYYNIYMQATKFSYRRRFRAGMKQLRREAALERQLAAAERTIETQARKLGQEKSDAEYWYKEWCKQVESLVESKESNGRVT